MVCGELIRDGELRDGRESHGIHEAEPCKERYWLWACGELETLAPPTEVASPPDPVLHPRPESSSSPAPAGVFLSDDDSAQTTAAHQLGELLAGRFL